MKKTALFIVFMTLIFYRTSIMNANLGNQNLLNPDTLNYESTSVWSIAGTPINTQTSYVFMMPNKGYFGGTESTVTIRIMDDQGNVLINESIINPSQCSENNDKHVCVFETTSVGQALWFELEGSGIGAYIDAYGFFNFQLSVGDTSSSYVPYGSTSEPYFQGEGLLITSYTTALLLDTIIGTHITAEDEYDGDLTDEITIVSDTYSGFETTVGEYTVLLSVKDSSDNETEFLLTIHVIDDVPPVVEGPEVISMPVNTTTDIIVLIKDRFTIYDAIDGPIDVIELLHDEYSEQRHVLGEKLVTFKVEDSSGNETITSFTVNLLDETPPTIIGPLSLRMNLSQARSREVLYSHFTITDNHTEYEDLIIEWHDQDGEINFNVTGVYQTLLYVKDASGNETDQMITVEIYDDVPPVLLGPATLRVPYHALISMETILQQITVSDNYKTLTHNDITILENHYDPLHAELGYYKIVYAVSDDNHQVTLTIHVHVIDDVPPVFMYSERIMVEAGTQISVDTLFKLLTRSNDFGTFNPIGVRYTESIEERFNQPGTQALLVELYDENGEFIVYEVVFEVFEETPPASFHQLYLGLTLLILSGLAIVIKTRRP